MSTRCIVSAIVTLALLIFWITRLSPYIKARLNGEYQSVPFLSTLFLLLSIFYLCLSIYAYEMRAKGLQYEAIGDYSSAFQCYKSAIDMSGDAFSDLAELKANAWYPSRYAEATDLYKGKDYLNAMLVYIELGDYANSEACVERCMRAYLDSK